MLLYRRPGALSAPGGLMVSRRRLGARLAGPAGRTPHPGSRPAGPNPARPDREA
jgi:hypothetical protein